jgi:hypothetical protein
VFGRRGNITKDIIANFKVLFSSSLLIFSIIFSIYNLDESIKVKIIDKIIAICEYHIITNTQRKNVNKAAISEVTQACSSLNIL